MRSISLSRILSMLILILLVMGFISSCSPSAAQEPGAEPPAAGNNQSAPENTQAPEPTAQTTNTPAPSPVPPTPTPQILPLSVSEPVVLQKEKDVFYVFNVENPNPDYGLEFAKYSLAFLDVNGKELKLEQDLFLPCLLPEQKIEVAGLAYVEEGTVSKVQIALSNEVISVARSELQAVMDKPITVDNLKVSAPLDGFSSVTGFVANPLDVDLGGPEVYLVAYDTAGQIVGGGKANVGFVLPNDSSGFVATILAPDVVDRIETYPVVLRFNDLLVPNTPPEGVEPPIMVNSGFGMNKFGSLDAALVLTNPNSKHAVSEKFMMVAYGSDGSVLGAAYEYVTLPPGATMGVSRMVFLTSQAQVDRVDVKILPIRYEEADAVPEFPYTISKIEAGGFGQTVTGEISNPTANEYNNLIVHAIAYDELGQIIGAYRIRVENLPANGKANVEFDFALESAPAKVELYPEPDF